MVENSKLQGNLTYQFTVYLTVLTLLNDVNITIIYTYIYIYTNLFQYLEILIIAVL